MSSWDGPARLGATDGAAHRVLGVVVLLLAPVVVLVVGIATPSRSPAPYVAGALAQLLGVGFLLWLVSAWRRPTRRPRRADLVLVVAPVVVAAVSLWLLLALAEAHGIRGSAVPRVRQGIPFAADLAYLAAVAGAVATLVVAVVLLGVLGLALHASTVRPRGDAGPTVRARVLHRLETAPADPLPPATSDDDPWLRRLLPPRPAVLLVLPAVAPAAGLLAILHGDATHGVVGAVVALTVPVLVTAWVVLRSTWRPDAQLGVVMAALWRTMSAPFVTAAAGVPAALVVAVLPGSADRFAADRRWSAALGDVLPSPGTTAPTWVLLSALVALLGAMLVGLVLSVAVVLPLTALLRPEQVIRDNAMSTATDDRPANVVAVRALAVLVPLALLAVLLLVGADAGSVRQVVGVLVAVVAVGLAWVVRTGQRTSRPERASDG